MSSPTCYTYSYNFFVQDFPLLQNELDKENTINILRDGKASPISFKREWYCPDQLKLDEAFMTVDKKEKSRRNLRRCYNE